MTMNTITNEEIEEPQTNNLTMPKEARRAVVFLMRHGVVLAEKKAQLFEHICLHQQIIRQYLSEVFINLILDEKFGVAYIANIEADAEDGAEEETASLIVRRTLTLFDTLILLILRKYYQEREAAGERKIVIDIDKVESNLTPFLPLTNSTKLERKKIHSAMQRMVTKKIISPLRNDEDRFEITPIIRYIVSAAFLETMLEQYLTLTKESHE
jgi:hypothetical protein